MDLEYCILINMHGQDLILIDDLIRQFRLSDHDQKKATLNMLLYLIMQSKPKDEDINAAIHSSKLKATYTPCVILLKGVGNHNLEKIVALPDDELEKAFVLLLSLFKVAYKRRYTIEKNDPNKWWYWDLSDKANIQKIRTMNFN